MKTISTYSFTLPMILVLLLVIGNSRNPLVEAGESDNVNINFKWAVLKLDLNNHYEILNNQRRPRLTSDDLLKIFIQPSDNTYVYIYLLDSKNDLQLIFPDSIDYFDNEYKFGNEYFIPVGKNFFAIDDHKGTEKLYLLASAKRLNDLESLTKGFLNASGDKKTAIKAEVLKEIKSLKTHFGKSSRSSEKPIPIAGAFRTRGIKDIDEGLNATQVDATNFYSKTVRLEH